VEPAALVRGALYTSALEASQQNDTRISVFSSILAMPLNLRANLRYFRSMAAAFTPRRMA
jgi:hypothetical protein